MRSAKGINLTIGPEDIIKYDKQLKKLKAADAINKPTEKELTWAKQHALWLYDNTSILVTFACYRFSAESWL